MWSRTSAPEGAVDWYGYEWLNSAQDELSTVERLERLLHERKYSVRKCAAAEEPIGLLAANLTIDTIDSIDVARSERIQGTIQDFQGVHGAVDNDDDIDEDDEEDLPDTPETPHS